VDRTFLLEFNSAKKTKEIVFPEETWSIWLSLSLSSSY